MNIYKENGFVFIIDSPEFFRLSDIEFNELLSKHPNLEYSELNNGKLSAGISNFSNMQNSGSRFKWIRFPKKSCLIIDSVDPPIRFNGEFDIKDMDSIITQYGKVPDQISMLISMKKLVMISEDDAKVLFLEKEEQKKSIVKSKHGVQRRDGIDMGGDSEDHESLEDRLIRKATKISA